MAELVGGAVLGAVVGELLKDVILMAQRAYWCKKNCKSLLETLDAVSPLLDDIEKSARIGNANCQAWLESFCDLLTKARNNVEACSSKKWTNYIKRTKLSSKIIAIDKQIQDKLHLTNLVTLCAVQEIGKLIRQQPSKRSSVVQTIPDTRLQDIPRMTVPFVANPFERVKNKILNCSNQMDVPMTIGLKGKGGCGKTLLAKMVNNDPDIQRKYGGDVLWITIGRDATIPSLYLTMAKLLHDGGAYERNYMHRNLEDQRGYLVQVFQEKKVLLILDDVWDNYPLNSRAMIEWLDVAKGLGSMTLITTRDISVLRRVKCIDVVDVQSLSEDDSWELFCTHAFENKKPPTLPIEDIAKAICEQCDGLPLAIKVSGSAMWEKVDEREWRHTLNYLKGATTRAHPKFVEKEVEKKLYDHLQFSYDELDDTSKKCFLHFAAFPEDDKISTYDLCNIWHAQELFGAANAEETRDAGKAILIDLVDRSLIDMSGDGEHVQIHDVLRDLANHILSKAQPSEWAFHCYFQVGKVFETFPAIGSHVKIVSLIGCSFREFPNILELPSLQVCLLSKILYAQDIQSSVIPIVSFLKMKELRLLSMSESDVLKSNFKNFECLTSLMYLDLSSSLLWKQLPKGIKELKSLTHLNLQWCTSLAQLPKGIKELKSLTHLELGKCSALTQLPEGIKELKCLTHLDLGWCTSLTQLPEDIKELKSLTYLKLRACSFLTQLPEGIKELKSLMHLDLHYCVSLMQLPEGIKELKSLVHLDLQYCRSLMQLPESIKELKSLTYLGLEECSSLMQLPEGIKELKSLTHLDLQGCSSLTQLPEDIKELKSLTHLDLQGCSSLTQLPEGIKELKSLTHLDLQWCRSLTQLPEGIKELKSLTHLDLQWCRSLTQLPEGVKELKSLTHLDLQWCRSLTQLPEGIKELKSLTHLDLQWCRSLTQLPEGVKELKSLTHLDLKGCWSLTQLPKGMKELKSLTHLKLNECTFLPQLPEGIKELKSLMHLELGGCLLFTQLPEAIKELKSLMHLDLEGCRSLTQLPEGIKELKSLTHLKLRGCSSLTQLPEGIKELKSLTHLELGGCLSLTQLPEGIKELKSLTHLELGGCLSLTQLPEGITELNSLTHLQLPEDIKEVKSLMHLELGGCSSLTQLPKS